MNIINVDISFEKQTCITTGNTLITGDYNSTKLIFNFDKSEGRKVFEMISPDNKLVFSDEIQNNEVILTRNDAENNFCSIFNKEGYYTFEVSLYGENSKLTSMYGRLYVEKEKVNIDGELVEVYLPIFDKLLKTVDNSLKEMESIKEKVVIANEEANNIINEFNNKVDDTINKINKIHDDTAVLVNDIDNKLTEYNNNASEKLSVYNTNATSKLNDYNTNADTKLQEYNTNADNKIAEYDLHSQELDNKIVSTRNELERVKNDVLETGTDTDTFVHLEDSAMAEYQELSVDGVCEQKTTSIANGDEYDSPSPDHPQEIKTIENSLKITSCNKNLFDKNKPNILNAYINVVNGEIGSDDVTSIFVKCKQNTNYTISKIISSRFIVGTTSVKPQNKVMCNTFKRNDNGTNITISTNSNDKYLIVYVLNSKDELTLNQIFDSLQIEENPTATTFEQHLETQIEVNLPEGEFIGKINDTYKDILKVEYNEDDGQYHLVLNKMIGKVVLDGSESGSIRSDIQNENTICYRTDAGITNIKSNVACLSNYFECKNDISDTEHIRYTGASGYRFQIFLLKTTATTDSQVRAWLSTHNTEVYYALAEPYTVDLGVVDMPITYNEITNLFTDSDLLPKINAKYYRNFISTIQNLQVNEKALKQELIDINTRLSALENASTNVVSESEVIE